MPFHWLLAVFAAVGLGAAATAWLWLVRRRRDEADAGLMALAGMRWREFSRFVLDAMRHRGYEVEADPGGARQTEFVMRRDGRTWLLACRHGEHAGADARTTHALETALLANGAAGGILVVSGSVDPQARRAIAAQPKLQLLEGPALWRELAPMLPETLRDEAASDAARLARGRTRLAWLGAAAMGIAVLLFGGRAHGPRETIEPPPLAATPAAPATAVPAPSEPAAVTTDGDPDPAEEAFDRSQVALAIASLPGIADAAWVTESTLLVELRSDADERLAEICRILEEYETLRTSRLQLQPAPGSTAPVRFRQCRVF